MEKSNKLYLKALNKYQGGYIDQAIEICEESISINMKNKASVNLKGLLYYLKGDIDSAKALWKLNYEVNNDEVSKKYLQGLREDEKRLALYTKAVGLIKELHIKEALTLLMECKESDYNCINVNNAISTCYIKFGQYENAVTYVNEVLKVDMKNDTALMHIKELRKYGVSGKSFINKSNEKFINTIAITAIVVFCIFVGKYSIDFVKNISLNNKEVKTPVENKENVEKKEAVDKVEKKTDESKTVKPAEMEKSKVEAKKEETQKEVFPYEAMKKSLENNEYYKLHEYLSKWKGKEVDANYKALLSKVEESLKQDGVTYFYKEGREYLTGSKEYNKAVSNFSKAYLYGKQSYLYQDILYMLGVTYERNKDNANAVKYYSEYDAKFPKGNYEEEVLYRLALMYKDVDLKKSKEYAKKLTTNFSNSQYNNSIIKKIINE